MSKKKISIKPAAEIRSIEKDLDNWVKKDIHPTDYNEGIKPLKEIELYRLSLDIPKFLHKRIKKTCAVEEISIKDKLTGILLEEFPES